MGTTKPSKKWVHLGFMCMLLAFGLGTGVMQPGNESPATPYLINWGVVFVYFGLIGYLIAVGIWAKQAGRRWMVWCALNIVLSVFIMYPILCITEPLDDDNT